MARDFVVMSNSLVGWVAVRLGASRPQAGLMPAVFSQRRDEMAGTSVPALRLDEIKD
jgi:hypothetical protein